MKRLFFLFILIFSIAYSTERTTIVINDFSFGLNTVKRGYDGNLGEGTTVHNFDLWKHPGALTVRDGYDSVFAVPGLDSFLWNGLHAINFVDGTKKLALVGDSSGAGYANVYVTGNNQLEYGTIDSFFCTPNAYYWRDVDDTDPDGDSIFYSYFRITPYGQTSFLSSCIFDTAYLDSPQSLIDSAVIKINASSVSSYVTASRVGDTLLIVEDNADANVSLAYTASDIYPNPFGGHIYPREYFTPRRNNGYITSANRITTYFPATGQLWWTQFKGVTYLGTGTGKAISYDGRTVNKFPMKAPGEVDIIPLTTSGNLDGTYRYAMVYGSPSDSVADTVKYTTIGYLSTPVVADSQQILLKDFPLPNADYYYEGSDTVTIEIWRTVGDIGRLDKADSIWYTGISVTMTDSSDYANTIVIDTMSDSLIRLNSSQVIADGDLRGWQSGKIDTTLHKYTSKPGAPSIVSWGSANGNLGIWGEGEEADASADTVDWTNAAGYSYMCVFVDTTLNSPSDSGRSFNFYQGGNLRNNLVEINAYNDSTTATFAGLSVDLGFARKTTEKITLALPRATSSSAQVLLYRGVILPIKFDTSSVSSHRDPRTQQFITGVTSRIASDSFAVPYYYLIGSFNPGDTIVDSLCYDSLLVRETYKRNAVPPLIKQMVTVDNQLLATDGQYFYESEPSSDSVAFNILVKSPVNLDDGDEITTLIPQRGVVRLLKNRSTYILRRDSDGYWRDIEASKHYGSVSALSHASAPEGDYFLSNDGVRLEDENIYREKSNIGSLMSGQLDNFNKLSLAQKKNCFAKYIDGKYILSFPALDSSYVLNKVQLRGQNRYAWSTWDKVVMTGGDYYAVRKDNIVYPGDTLYFTKSGSNGIYRYGTSKTDNGSDIDYVWSSSQLTQSFDTYKQVKRISFDLQSTDTVDASHQVSFWDERLNSSTSELVIRMPRLDTSYSYLFSSPTADVNKSWRVVLSKNPLVDGLASGGAGQETIYKQIFIELINRGSLPTR